jgi:hypothetical protein
MKYKIGDLVYIVKPSPSTGLLDPFTIGVLVKSLEGSDEPYAIVDEPNHQYREEYVYKDLKEAVRFCDTMNKEFIPARYSIGEPVYLVIFNEEISAWKLKTIKDNSEAIVTEIKRVPARRSDTGSDSIAYNINYRVEGIIGGINHYVGTLSTGRLFLTKKEAFEDCDRRNKEAKGGSC